MATYCEDLRQAMERINSFPTQRLQTRFGTFVLKWQLHWVSGWAPEHGEYRAAMVDNYGHADVYRDTSRATDWCSSRWGTGRRLRFTWDASDPSAINWRNEMSTGDRSWFLIEEYPMVPVASEDGST